MANLRMSRIQKELKNFEKEPPQGISVSSEDDTFTKLAAQIIPDRDSPYSDGVFKLRISIPENYPLDPPTITFVTPVYHPNIDSSGRICLDSLKSPPKGTYSPVQTLASLLTCVRILMSEPNLDDPLMHEIAAELKASKELFTDRARQHTLKYAVDNLKEPSSNVDVKPVPASETSNTFPTQEKVNRLSRKRKAGD